MKYLLFVLSLLILPIAAFAQETGFVPLTQVPGLTDMGNSFNLSSFLNTLYRLAIGVAAVVAVLQIMRAGIMYMGGDSVTEKKEAKNLIGLSIAGLILVLSPVIVFSIINPEILSLKIGRLEELAPSSGEIAGQGDGTCGTRVCDAEQGLICRQGQCVAITENTCSSTIANGTSLTNVRGERCCQAQTGCTVQARVIENFGEQKFCSCQAPTPPTPSASLFAWKGIYYKDSQCAIDPARAQTCPTEVLRGGAYQTKAQCQQEFEAATAGKVLLGSIKCSCEFDMGSQLGGYCLSDTP